MRKSIYMGLCVLGYFMFGLAISLYTGHFGNLIFVWNVFLAYVPIVFAGILTGYVARGGKSRVFIVVFAVLWLLFFPNAPYLVTDLIYFGNSEYYISDALTVTYTTSILMWIKIIYIGTAVFFGPVMGLDSLYDMHRLVKSRKGGTAGANLCRRRGAPQRVCHLYRPDPAPKLLGRAPAAYASRQADGKPQPVFRPVFPGVCRIRSGDVPHLSGPDPVEGSGAEVTDYCDGRTSGRRQSMPFIDSPITIRGHEIRNRIAFAPTVKFFWSEEGGRVSKRSVRHYEDRAWGGAGLIVVEATCVAPDALLSVSQLGLWEDGQIAGHKDVADACRKHGAVTLVQIHHAGMEPPVFGRVAGISVRAVRRALPRYRGPGNAGFPDPSGRPAVHGRRPPRQTGGVRRRSAPRVPRISAQSVCKPRDEQAHGRIRRRYGQAVPPGL